VLRQQVWAAPIVCQVLHTFELEIVARAPSDPFEISLCPLRQAHRGMATCPGDLSHHRPVAYGRISIGGRPAKGPGDNMAFTLTSSAFAPTQPIPPPHSRAGENTSPDLAWQDTPPGTQTLALIVDDPDARFRAFTHWVLFNIPATLGGLPAGVPHGDQPANAGTQGRNDYGDIGYGGPQPPPGRPHHYRFTLYALDSALPLRPRATKRQVLSAMRRHILGQAQLIGTFQHRTAGASR
jgi:Raf kinase inhibitor-like YbhB/YbcL family protein